MGIVLGFSGSRDGMTARQLGGLAVILLERDITELHHGACAGADAECQRMFLGGRSNAMIVWHPGPYGPHKTCQLCNIDAAEGYDWRTISFRMEPRKHFLTRNQDIVDESDLVVCAPKSMADKKSGTWSTINRANKAGKELIVLEP